MQEEITIPGLKQRGFAVNKDGFWEIKKRHQTFTLRLIDGGCILYLYDSKKRDLRWFSPRRGKPLLINLGYFTTIRTLTRKIEVFDVPTSRITLKNFKWAVI